MEYPLISVLIGVYYRREDTTLLERSIGSALAQSYPNLELLICDDGSNPQAIACLDVLAAQNGCIRLIRQGDLFTLPVKLNACLARAKGEWIARMDDDDFSHPQRLERQLRFLQEHPEAAFVGCNANLIRGGEAVGVRTLPQRPTVRDFYFVQPYIHPTLLFRRDALQAVGGYSEDKRCILCEDYDLLLRLYEAGYTGANVQEILFDYTLPATTKGSRRMIHRWNETVTRWRRFRRLGQLPRALPYVVKPLIVGLIPEALLKRLKRGL